MKPDPKKAAAVALQRRLRENGDAVVSALEVWLYGVAFLPVHGTRRPSGPSRRRKVARVIASSVRVASEFDASPRDYVRLDAVLRYGLERRVGERLSSTAGRVYAALLQLEREAPGYGVCKRCHVVWSERRADAVLCKHCKVTRIPTVPSEGGWTAVPGPRFNASREDMRHRLVQTYCAGCGEPFFRPTDRHKYCKPACRQLAYRRRNAT